MILTRLTIFNYKNIAEADLMFSSNVNCLLGRNGEGKTNLLDAINFLSMTRSYGTTIDSMVIRHDADFMSLQGIYAREDGTPEDIHCGIKRGQKKVMRRGKKAYQRLSDHLGLIPLVMVSPADHVLIGGGSEERRRFMDAVICQYDHSYTEALQRYNKALQQRNALLKLEEEPDEALMLIWEEQMAREGKYIYKCRKAYIEEFVPVFQQFHDYISMGHEKVGLRFMSHCERGPLLDQLTGQRFKDRAVGYSLHGIHRDDLEMTLDGFALKMEGSQGQNKTYLIALKLAQFDFLRRTSAQTTPLLLLDDIFDKLDAGRVEQIVKLVGSDRFGQIFVTDTNRDHLDNILSATTGDYKIFHVEGGKISS